MSRSRRILLIGRGPLPKLDTPVLGFSQLRTQCFLDALEAGGHGVRLALLTQQNAPNHVPDQWAGVTPVGEEGPGWLEHLRALAEGAEVIVTAGPYNPGRAACLIAQEQPVWADVPGDPFAELSALSDATQRPLEPARIAASEAAIMPVLARADALSVISVPQRYAALGALGATGRLSAPNTTPSVQVIPIAARFGLPALPPRSRSPDQPLVVALSGGFNPWFDETTVIAGLEKAMTARSQIQVLVTGGGLEGFYTDGFERFVNWAKNSVFKERIDLAGWLPHGALTQRLNRAHIGLSLDRPGLEPELGSRTRLLFFVHMGLLPVSTAICSLAKEMAQKKELIAVAHSDPSGLASTLCELADADASTETILRAQTRLSRVYATKKVTEPLLDWLDSPRRCAPIQGLAASLAAELSTSRDALAQIHESPTWRTLSAIHRLVRRD